MGRILMIFVEQHEFSALNQILYLKSKNKPIPDLSYVGSVGSYCFKSLKIFLDIYEI